VNRLREGWRRAPSGVRRSYVLLVISVVGWVVSAVLQALGVPIFEQVMLAISWGALAYTAIQGVITVRAAETGCPECEHCKREGLS
jgi:hypothetical protein